MSHHFHKSVLAAAISMLLSAGALAQTGTGPGADSAVGDTMRGDMGLNPTYPDDTQVDVADEEAKEEAGEPVTNAAAAGDDDDDAMIYESAEAASERRERIKNQPEQDERETKKYEAEKPQANAAEADERPSVTEDNDLSAAPNGTWRDTKSAFTAGWLEGKLETALLLNEQLETSEIDVNISGSEAILSGAASSEVQKELAGQIALGIDGIEAVDNRLQVKQKVSSSATASGEGADSRRSFTQYVADVTTTAAIKTRLLANDDVKGRAIEVDTFDDTVTLSGSVETDAQKQLAERLARDSHRVEEVLNNLEVTQAS